MADNLPVTPGIGRTVRMDELPDLSLVQYMKLMDGTQDSVVVAKIDTTGVWVNVQASPILGEVQASPTANTVLDRLKSLLTGIVLSAGENHIGEAGSPADVISITPTISTSPAYTIGDAVGGIQTITNAVRVSGGKCILQSLMIVDKGNQKKPFTILFFDSNPGAATITDNAAFAFSTDISNVVAKINVLSTDYETVNGLAIASLGIGSGSMNKIMKANGSVNLYAAVVVTDTPTYLSTTDLTFKYGFGQA